MARGRRVRVGQPDVQGPEAGLGAEADQGDEEDGARARGRARGGDRVEVEAARVLGEHREEREEEGDADVGGDEVGDARAAHLVALVLEGDEEEGAQRHHLPGHEEEDAVAGEHDCGHRGDEQVEERRGHREPALARVAGQIAAAVDRGEPGDEEDAEQEEGAQRIHSEVEASDRQAPREPQTGRAAGAFPRQREPSAREPDRAGGKSAERTGGERGAVAAEEKQGGERAREQKCERDEEEDQTYRHGCLQGMGTKWEELV